MAEDQILKKGFSEVRLETNPNIQEDDRGRDSSSLASLGRREFISNIGMVTTATLAASVLGLSSI